MNFKNFLKIIGFYFFSFVIFSLIFFFLLRLSIFNKEEVLFYRGLIILIITTLIFGLILFFIKKTRIKFELIFSVLIFCFSFHLVFFVIFPVTFERSVTMFLLKTINSKNGINKNDLEKILINDYIKKNKALEKRLIEQKEIDFLRVKKKQSFYY